MTPGFSRTPPSTDPSGHDVRIYLRTVNQRFDWPAAEAVEIFPTKNPPAMQPLVKIL